MQMTFEVLQPDSHLLELRWPIAFGKVRTEPYQVLATLLEGVGGVNRVEVLRYSAHLELAPVVEDVDLVIDELYEVLTESTELEEVLRHCGVTDYGVTVA
jgi:hypothetical protein